MDPQLIVRAVPRNTSYPTAAEFRSVGADFHQNDFSSIPEAAPIYLYLHVPCRKKICWYCVCKALQQGHLICSACLEHPVMAQPVTCNGAKGLRQSVARAIPVAAEPSRLLVDLMQEERPRSNMVKP